jgi:hypothetical protein
MAYTDSELLDLVETAIADCLLGKDVMFDGHRVTTENLSALRSFRDDLVKKIRRKSGNGMTVNNVGLMKR